MTTPVVKVGDVVAWDDVPSMSLCEFDNEYVVRLEREECGVTVAVDTTCDPCGIDGQWHFYRQMWLWSQRTPRAVTIIALDLTGNETADELRALAEAFERDHHAA